MTAEELTVIDHLAAFTKDPLGFVLYSFPWGEPGELANALGPELWQVAILEDLGRGLIDVSTAIRLARTSGHGIGKSALVAWIILWAISTFEDTLGVVTANTETQLKTKTWVQLAKWYRLFIGKDYFKMSATKLCALDPAHEDTWRVDMVPWSERNTEAFAGLHNLGKRILVVFDEASAIPDVIWETTEGALTDKDTQIIWAAFGNPTRNTGRFRDCFKGGKFEKRWNSAAIDSRSVSFTDKKQIAEWIEDYGEDSDFVRVRVKGIFPRVDADSFIPYELAYQATLCDLKPTDGEPIVLGVDVGRFGDDPSVIYPRKGLDARTIPVEVMYGLDTMQTAARVAATLLRLRASCAFVDEGGVGAGVVDRLNQLRVPVVGVNFGAGPDNYDLNDGAKYANKRAEIHGAVRTYLKRGGCIPERIHGIEVGVVDEFCAPTFGLNNQDEIQIESKKDMRRRGVKSTNILDALGCSLAYPTFIPTAADLEVMRNAQEEVTKDYNPYESERIYAS